MHTRLYYDQLTWLPLRISINSFRDLHSHTVDISKQAVVLPFYASEKSENDSVNVFKPTRYS